MLQVLCRVQASDTQIPSTSHIKIMSLGFFGQRFMSDRRLKIKWPDFTHLWQSFLPDSEYNAELDACQAGMGLEPRGKLVRVTPRGKWGRSLQDIAESQQSGVEKNRRVAELCWEILVLLRFGEDELVGDEPWCNPEARLWKDEEDCPAECWKAAHIAEGCGTVVLKERYPALIFGDQAWVKDGEVIRNVIRFRLHRFVCWLSVGMVAESEPGVSEDNALHFCHGKHCLRLRCIRWGTKSDNWHDKAASLREKGKQRQW